MLEFMRKKARSWSIKLTFLIIVIVFIFWGIGSFRAEKDDLVATVNGQKIRLKEFLSVYESSLNFYRSLYQDKFSEELIKKLKFKEMVLEDLINRILLLGEAKKLGLKVTEEELRANISRNPLFQKEGRFNQEIYLRVLANHRLNPKDFEERQRDSLLVSEMEVIIQDSVKVSERELADAYQFFPKTPLSKEDFALIFFRQKREVVYREWLKGLREKARITLNQKLLE